MLERIAKKLLITPLNHEVETIDNLVDEIYDQHFGLIFANALKTDSNIHIDLSFYSSELMQTPSKTKATDNDIWIFGYGSLMWKADFPYVSKQTGYIKGFIRRFYQNSTDHRGTPKKPGRVVTLLPSSNPESKVCGVAYRISSSAKEDVLKHLDYREKDGYERFQVKFYAYNCNMSSDKNAINSEDKNAIDLIVYVANENNKNFCNISDLDDITNQIYTSIGPSGSNREYVYKLANCMKLLFPDENDDHLFKLEAKLREKEKYELEISNKVRHEIKKKIEEILKSQISSLDNIEEFLINLKDNVKNKLSIENSSESSIKLEES